MSGEKSFDVTAFGESMLRLSVPKGQRLVDMRSLDVHFAGAETNVLAALACLDHKCGWVGGLPDGEIGRYALRQLAASNIASKPILLPDSRLGTYYVEFAAPPRSTQVIYDRANSAVTQLEIDQLDLDFLLDTRLLHLTGITPALGPKSLKLVQLLVDKAKQAQVPISFDINFRSKLWSTDEARQALRSLVHEVDLLMCSESDATKVFGCNGSAETIIEQLAELAAVNKIVLSVGDEGVFGWDGSDYYQQDAFPVTITDRIGAGDALAAGVIHGWLANDFEIGLQYGTLLAAMALSQAGDQVITTSAEVATLLDNADSNSDDSAIQR